MKLADFEYYLPEELIASSPMPRRDQSRLLVLEEGNTIADHQFSEVINYINPGDLLVINNTKVVKGRLSGSKPTGGKVEMLLERVIDDRNFLAHIKTGKAKKIGMEIILPANLSLTITERLEGGLFRLAAATPVDLYGYLEQNGKLPLPPYMQRQAMADDEKRYQTVYARHEGSVAAPTAGLHFTEEMIKKIAGKGAKIAHLTLHVGSGTFKPVSTENIEEHKMHSEIFNIDQTTIDLLNSTRTNGGKIISVGTTSLHALETVALRGLMAQSGETDIFITPGFKFKLVDKLITNFHLPKSTLLMLAMAFAGQEEIKACYQHAIEQKYRFFSYGDAMLLNRKEN